MRYYGILGGAGLLWGPVKKVALVGGRTSYISQSLSSLATQTVEAVALGQLCLSHLVTL